MPRRSAMQRIRVQSVRAEPSQAAPASGDQRPVDRDGDQADPEPVALSAVEAPMFLFFSNRIGCVLSLLISAAGTILLLALLGWVRF